MLHTRASLRWSLETQAENGGTLTKHGILCVWFTAVNVGLNLVVFHCTSSNACLAV